MSPEIFYELTRALRASRARFAAHYPTRLKRALKTRQSFFETFFKNIFQTLPANSGSNRQTKERRPFAPPKPTQRSTTHQRAPEAHATVHHSPMRPSPHTD